jgi:hypothetical protein
LLKGTIYPQKLALTSLTNGSHSVESVLLLIPFLQDALLKPFVYKFVVVLLLAALPM